MGDLEIDQIFDESDPVSSTEVILSPSPAPVLMSEQEADPDVNPYVWIVFGIAMLCGILLAKSFNWWKW